MQPKFTVQEALRTMRKLPGFELDTDGFGHKILTPEGLLWTRGAKITDEIFESESLGTLNISEIHRNTSDPGAQLQPIPIEVALKNTSRIDINRAYAKRISKARLREPILSIFADDGLHIIDGAHRIYRLNALRKNTVYSKILLPEVIRLARVKRWLMGQSGDWVPHDRVSDEQIEKIIEGGKEFMRAMEEQFQPHR